MLSMKFSYFISLSKRKHKSCKNDEETPISNDIQGQKYPLCRDNHFGPNKVVIILDPQTSEHQIDISLCRKFSLLLKISEGLRTLQQMNLLATLKIGADFFFTVVNNLMKPLLAQVTFSINTLSAILFKWFFYALSIKFEAKHLLAPLA